MAVKAFGKFFSWEESLFWPGSENNGDSYPRVLGHKLKAKAYRNPRTKPEADFSAAPGVYLLHDRLGEVIYVGQAKRLIKRLMAHSGDHLRDRWTHYSWFATGSPCEPNNPSAVGLDGVELENSKDDSVTLSLSVLEAVLRTAFEPRLNLQEGRWENTPQYAQSLKYEFVYLREVYEEIRAQHLRGKEKSNK